MHGHHGRDHHHASNRQDQSLVEVLLSMADGLMQLENTVKSMQRNVNRRLDALEQRVHRISRHETDSWRLGMESASTAFHEPSTQSHHNNSLVATASGRKASAASRVDARSVSSSSSASSTSEACPPAHTMNDEDLSPCTIAGIMHCALRGASSLPRKPLSWSSSRATSTAPSKEPSDRRRTKEHVDANAYDRGMPPSSPIRHVFDWLLVQQDHLQQHRHTAANGSEEGPDLAKRKANRRRRVVDRVSPGDRTSSWPPLSSLADDSVSSATSGTA